MMQRLKDWIVRAATIHATTYAASYGVYIKPTTEDDDAS